jgi:type II secretory pathway pseudopilin PulG
LRDREATGIPAAHGEAGFTLVELLVAGLILSMAMIGIALMFGQAQTYLSAEVDDRIGVGLAQQKIEALRGLGFDCIPVGDGGDPDAPGPHAPLTLGPGTLTNPACADATSQAARKYNEDEADHAAADDPEHQLFKTGYAGYMRRFTRVECVDPTTFQPPCNDPALPLAKKITVEVTPRSEVARAIRVETALTAH